MVLRDHLRFVAPGVGKGMWVLDVGCGGGSFLAGLASRGARVVGLDSSRRATAVSWQENAVPAVCASLENTPFAAECFGAITLFHVLEHVPHPNRYLDAARRLLA